jgi:pyrophosphatase PpaX
VRFETVLFDLDGTLVDSAALILSSFRHATRSVLGRVIPDDVLMANVGGHGLRAQMEAFDDEHVDELVSVYREHNHAAYRDVHAFPGIDQLLERLRGEGRRLGVVTVKSRATTELTFELLAFGRYFDAVVTGDDTERHKPDPEPLLRALAELGSTSDSAAYVGDSPFDIQAAKAAGTFAVAVGWGGIHPKERLEAQSPDRFVETPAELASIL